MAIHNILGKAGEDAAAKYLEQNGYTIRDRNWRKNHLELDIVADKDKELIIVEVKTRCVRESSFCRSFSVAASRIVCISFSVSVINFSSITASLP